MGMYTGLRCKFIVKKEFRPLIKRLMDNGDWTEIASGYDFIEKFAEYPRADFIPFGALAYMPDEWQYIPVNENGKYDWDNAKATDGFEHQFDEKTGYWAFQCSLKNYESTIEAFFTLIVDNIVEKIIHLEKYYEEWTYSERWDFVDGKVRCVDEKFIKYVED
jgi:hypothetical protein